MKLANLFKAAKKGSKVAGSQGKKKTAGGTTWPAGIRIGLFGHANSGKTVYLSILYEECKISKDLQISITDHATANEFLKHYREIWGLSTAVDSGTAVDLVGEKKFPDPTERALPLIFNATLDRTRKVAVVTYEYDGKAVAISSTSDQTEDVADFMANADGMLFFYDPKLLKAELESQAHVAAFVHMIERIAPLGSSLPVPIGLVITKSDILPGFTGEDKVVLIPTDDEALLAEDFETLMEHVLSSNRIMSDSAWAGTVREVMVRLQAFLKVVVGRTLDFQIFFTSATGQTPERIGSDVGRSIYAPPRKIAPLGVKAPFYWLLTAVVRNRKLSKFRLVSRWAALIAITWAVLYSLPNLYHFSYLLSTTRSMEDGFMKAYGGNVYNTSEDERRRIGAAYQKYESSWIVRGLYTPFLAPAGRIRNVYRQFDMSEATKQLNDVINTFSTIVSDQALWPKVNPSDNSVITSSQHTKLVDDLTRFHTGDSTSALYLRSGRALTYWDLFTRALIQPGDTTASNIIKRQVEQDQSMYPRDITPAEKQLGAVLSAFKTKQVSTVVAQATATAFDEQAFTRINSNTDAKYRFEDAVQELQSIKAKLDPSDTKHVSAIDKYLAEVANWSRPREYTCKFETIPAGAKAYLEVTEPGRNPQWTAKNMILQGRDVTFKWKPGQDIHIALDTIGHNCQWGNNASDYVVTRSKYGLFELEKPLYFPNVKMQVTVRFMPPLAERLPILQ
jgi:hypothetical protein